MSEKRRSYPQKLRRAEMEEFKKSTGCCSVCKQSLYKKGGYGGTGMCGPCCTGDASTIDEAGQEW